MKSSTLFLGFTILVLAGALTLLWQAFGPRSASLAPREAAPPVAVAPQRSEPEESAIRSVYPGGRPNAMRPPQPNGGWPPPSPIATRGDAPAPASPPAPERLATAEPPVTDATLPRGTEPPANGVDLNTASLEQLNGPGAGMIGRTIVANRPYSSPDDLVAKRILNRRDYETIRPHVFVP